MVKHPKWQTLSLMYQELKDRLRGPDAPEGGRSIDQREYGSGERMRIWRAVASVAVAAMLVTGCSFLVSRSGSGVTASGEVQLSSDQPAMAVEFETSFEVIDQPSFIVGHLARVRPDGSDLSELSAVEHEVWDGSGWVAGDTSDIANLGANTFRYRWVFVLADGNGETTIPFEAEIDPIWVDHQGDEPQPGPEHYANLAVEATSIYAIDY